MAVQTVATETVHASFTLIKILIAQGTGLRAATAIRTIPKIVPEHSALGIVEQITHDKVGNDWMHQIAASLMRRPRASRGRSAASG